jgi:uncharacterized protein YcbX
MPNPASTLVGVVEELWRYPVKSMIGEQLTATEVTESGLLGIARMRCETYPTARSQPRRIRGNGRTYSITGLR